jgi:hypothetical protein
LRLGIRGTAEGCRALVAGGSLVSGETDAEGYSWIELPPVKHFEVLVFAPAGA